MTDRKMKSKNEWEYITKRVENGIDFNIIQPGSNEKPKVLYKLHNINYNSINALIEQYIYATHPSQFNDVYDLHENSIIYDDEDVNNRFLNGNKNRDDVIQKKIDEDSSFRVTYIKDNLRNVILRKLGIYSMTSNPANILMWSYYGNHEGFMIEFDITQFTTFKYFGPFPINYQEELEQISMKKWGIANSILYQTNIKYKKWEHENEWRLLLDSNGVDMFTPNLENIREDNEHDRKFNYPLSAIKSISLGINFFCLEEWDWNSSRTFLEIYLKKNIKEKSQLLNFLEEKNIKTGMCVKQPNYSIKCGSVKVERIDDNHYIIHPQDN